MSKKLNDTVSKCAMLLNKLTQDDAEVAAQEIQQMFGYNTDPYPEVQNIRCPHCEFLFIGDITWDDMEGKQGTECPACEEEIILWNSRTELDAITKGLKCQK